MEKHFKLKRNVFKVILHGLAKVNEDVSIIQSVGKRWGTNSERDIYAYN